MAWALRPLVDLRLELQPLQASADAVLRARCIASDFAAPGCGVHIGLDSLRSINTGGVSYLGVPFTQQLNVTTGQLQPLWIGVDVPENASGVFSGIFTVRSGVTSPGRCCHLSENNSKISMHVSQ